ncbi:fibronectin type III-like domain-contianing protein [Prolixibacter sp. SD074]|uniref:fibronectin type III-like domain-contianing protein n=1 Tax=Prolixibacter sp. SD074 TaxID=2652391 RepID=UPI001281F983|nr:fibronectin type III-like domain-contianing protein [Prolixibacter sp. SD074]GET28592.1 hypothetical protein SD074_07940 [Prolixibacter sp. SD074]
MKDAKGNPPTENAVLDFTNPEAVKWYQDKLAGLLKMGVSAIKVDFGLSYTTFKYSNLKVSSDNMQVGKPLTISFNITNTRKRAGDEVAQLYVRHLHSEVQRTAKELKGFERITIQPGENDSIRWKWKKDGLHIFTPPQMPNSMTTVFKIKTSGKAILKPHYVSHK